MDKNISDEDFIKLLKKASKVLLKENKNYRADEGLQKIVEVGNILNK